ncbi:cell division protease FtsH [Prosthecobacter fusiformis]|uniref:ATP-dependent zinc metalloprotease FtsH n=1 Tax=Prosthecobacter fusiformis TaxID=48464 RepID=A0A4R7SSK9_9BACT|nr:ATP-dependent zinc metalloprotease FtsH [Prosthecobacter fusiformis]TDU81178.1 cell division protease FtsH [Prosthecobacter fusiformis]
MSDDSTPKPEGPNRRNQEPQFNWRGFLLLAMAILLMGSAYLASSQATRSQDISYKEFKELVEKDQIDKTKNLELIQQDTTTAEYIEGYAVSSAVTTETAPKPVLAPPSGTDEKTTPGSVKFRVPVSIQYQKEELQALMTAKGLTLIPKYENNQWGTLLVSMLPILLLLFLLYFLVRQQIKSAGRGALSFGKSKAKMLSQDRNKVTFKDVAGVEEAKEEVQELVEFLKDPKRFQRLGGKIPKGVLMVGSPGTGKTLLAKAIAGEADVPFFSISGSDFVEMFVGVGASRVRDMFEQGKKNAPCLIFIDEIDAVGRHRGHGMGGGHDEREQTLNALLVEMDGFDTQEGIIIIAATNRPDVLDPALLRPGRFDRQVTVSLPDVKGREEILNVHAKKVKLSENADLTKVARGTPGFSGAELANVINEAALLAARKNLKSIGTPELEEARDKVRWGRERRSLALSEKEKENTAYHEAGHAILIEVLEHTDPLHKVTIIPRGPSLGSTMWLPEEDKFTHRKSELLDDLVVAMGGRVAEEIQFGDVTNGAMGDIRQATAIARNMVCAWGMSDKMGMVEYGEGEQAIFLARDLARNRNYSGATAQKIDEEVKNFIDQAYAKAKEILIHHKDKLDAISAALLEYETLDGSQIKEIMQHGYMINPPKDKPKPPAPPPIPKAVETRPVAQDEEDLGGLPGGLAGVPA